MTWSLPVSYGSIPSEPDTGRTRASSLSDSDGYLFRRAPRLLWIRGALSDLSVLAPTIILVTIIAASVFYRRYNEWEISTAVYYACQTVAGIMYGVPGGEDRISKSFTLFLYFLGATYIYAFIAAYANLIAERAVNSAKDIVLMERVEDLDNDGVILPRDWIVYFCNLIGQALDWNNNKFMLITVGATLAWLGVGVAFGLYYEKYDLYTSVYFSLDAMMLSGTFAPPCIAVTAEGASPNDCTLGTTRAVFMSVYLLIGSPLFILTMGQFFESLVYTAQLSHQREKYSTDFTQEEFDFAATTLRTPESLQSSALEEANQPDSPHSSRSGSIPPSRSVDLAEFMLLELLRTEAISHKEIQYLKALFDAQNVNKTETIEYDGIEDDASEDDQSCEYYGS